jgi:hypothetical protein
VNCVGACRLALSGLNTTVRYCSIPTRPSLPAIRSLFERFDEFGPVRRVWLWFRSEGLSFPLQSIQLCEIQWIAPTYHTIHSVLTNQAISINTRRPIIKY